MAVKNKNKRGQIVKKKEMDEGKINNKPLTEGITKNRTMDKVMDFLAKKYNGLGKQELKAALVETLLVIANDLYSLVLVDYNEHAEKKSYKKEKEDFEYKINEKYKKLEEFFGDSIEGKSYFSLLKKEIVSTPDNPYLEIKAIVEFLDQGENKKTAESIRLKAAELIKKRNELKKIDDEIEKVFRTLAEIADSNERLVKSIRFVVKIKDLEKKRKEIVDAKIKDVKPIEPIVKVKVEQKKEEKTKKTGLASLVDEEKVNRKIEGIGNNTKDLAEFIIALGLTERINEWYNLYPTEQQAEQMCCAFKDSPEIKEIEKNIENPTSIEFLYLFREKTINEIEDEDLGKILPVVKSEDKKALFDKINKSGIKDKLVKEMLEKDWLLDEKTAKEILENVELSANLKIALMLGVGEDKEKIKNEFDENIKELTDIEKIEVIAKLEDVDYKETYKTLVSEAIDSWKELNEKERVKIIESLTYLRTLGYDPTISLSLGVKTKDKEIKKITKFFEILIKKIRNKKIGDSNSGFLKKDVSWIETMALLRLLKDEALIEKVDEKLDELEMNEKLYDEFTLNEIIEMAKTAVYANSKNFARRVMDILEDKGNYLLLKNMANKAIKKHGVMEINWWLPYYKIDKLKEYKQEDEQKKKKKEESKEKEKKEEKPLEIKEEKIDLEKSDIELISKLTNKFANLENIANMLETNEIFDESKKEKYLVNLYVSIFKELIKNPSTDYELALFNLQGWLAANEKYNSIAEKMKEYLEKREETQKQIAETIKLLEGELEKKYDVINNTYEKLLEKEIEKYENEEKRLRQEKSTIMKKIDESEKVLLRIDKILFETKQKPKLEKRIKEIEEQIQENEKNKQNAIENINDAWETEKQKAKEDIESKIEDTKKMMWKLGDFRNE